MRRFSLFLLLFSCCGLSGGCLSRQVAADGRNFRQALLEMYTDQVMDNLIRAYESKPFVQISYRALTVTDTQTVSASLSDEWDPTSMKNLVQRTSAILLIAHGYTNRLLFGGSFERDRQMQFQADPVAGKADVYDYYMGFARDPGLFCVADVEPRCDFHIKKKSCGRWYWIPKEASGVFLRLVLKTTFMRGSDPLPPITWSTVVTDVQPLKDKAGKSINGKYVITFGNEIPSDDGTLTVTLADGKLFKLPVVYHEQPQGKMVTTLNCFYPTTPSPGAPSIDAIKNHPATFYAKEFPNLTTTKSPEEERLDVAVSNYRQSLPKKP